MATQPRRGRPRTAEPTDAAGPVLGYNPKHGLRPSATPGVYLNALNVPCNELGVALSFMEVKRRDVQSLEEAAGRPVNTPAEFLSAVAMDPRQPMPVRIDAAKSAAPYTDRKQPVAVDGGLDPNGAPMPLFDSLKLKGVPKEKLLALMALLQECGLVNAGDAG